MKRYQLWMEGYMITGGRSDASFIGTSKGENFADAVVNYYNNHPEKASSFNKENLTYWGCQIYPSEREARETFG